MDKRKHLSAIVLKNENVLRVRAQNEHDLLFAEAIGNRRLKKSEATLSALDKKR